MSDQPKALKLIEQLDEIAMYSSKSATWALDAVNELERLYAVNQELVEALEKLSMLYDSMGAPRGPCRIIAEAALSKASGEA